MTSNAGSDYKNSNIGFAQNEQIKNEIEVMDSLKEIFRPEFLNRIDEIVMFEPLSKHEIRSIVDLMLQSLEKRLLNKQLKFEVTTPAKDLIIEQGYDVAFGARPLKRFIQHTVETMVARAIIQSNLKPNSTIQIDAKNDELQISVK